MTPSEKTVKALNELFPFGHKCYGVIWESPRLKALSIKTPALIVYEPDIEKVILSLDDALEEAINYDLLPSSEIPAQINIETLNLSDIEKQVVWFIQKGISIHSFNEQQGSIIGPQFHIYNLYADPIIQIHTDFLSNSEIEILFKKLMEVTLWAKTLKSKTR